MQPTSFSIFFPMYNEKANILQALSQAEAVMTEIGIDDYEILVIDDGSTDGSTELVENEACKNAHIRLYRHPTNLGYGVALRTGFTQARGELVFYTDCDLPADLSNISRALPLLDQADLVIGYRINRIETLQRALYSRIYNLLMRLMFSVGVRDVNFSFKMVHRSVLEHITLTAKTVFIDGQLLVEVKRYGFRIVEIPIEYQSRRHGRSNFDSLLNAWETLREMCFYWLELSRTDILDEKRL